MNLKEAKVGRVYNFDYKQPVSGETRRKLAKVVAIKSLTQNDIDRLEAQSLYRKHDSEFVRTETIVTCEMPNGEHRNFYAERTENCCSSILLSLMFWTGLARLTFRA